MTSNQINIIPGDFVYIPHLSSDVHEVQDKRHNFTFEPKLCVEIDGEDVLFTSEGYAKDDKGTQSPIAIAYPATQSYKESLESFWEMSLAPARPRQPTHSLDVREALERGETPLCWISMCVITQKQLDDMSLPINIISGIDENGCFITKDGGDWRYAQLVKPEEVFSVEQLGGCDCE